MSSRDISWPLIDEMPQNWRIDKTAGSPLTGYVFVTNGKSVINGQERALLKVGIQKCEEHANQVAHYLDNLKSINNKPKQIIDANYLRTVNELARAKMKERLLKDIMCDLMVCEIDGFSKIEYINDLKNMINSFIQSRPERSDNEFNITQE